MGTIQGASLVVFPSSEKEATKAESFPSFVQLLPSRNLLNEKLNTRKSQGRFAQCGGEKGFFLLYCHDCHVFSKSSKWNPPLVGAKIPSFFSIQMPEGPHTELSGLSLVFRVFYLSSCLSQAGQSSPSLQE